MPDENYSKGPIPVKDLSSLLRQRIAGNFSIEKVDWKNLTDPGENYGSLIIAVDATIRGNATTEVLHLVVKLPPPSSWLQQLFNSPITFVKELQFYRDVAPAFISLQRENGISTPESTWIGAKYYGGRAALVEGEAFDDQAAIVLENLNFQGYRTVDRLVGLSLPQSELAVRKLAELHAIAIAMRTKEPRVFEKLILPTLAQPANETAKSCVGDMISKALDDLKNMPECRDHLPAVLKTLEYAENAEKNAASATKNHWATLVHNDFWVNNMMFKNDEKGNAIDVKIVDFQLYVYDYGPKDLVFFLVSSPMIRVIDQHFDHLVDHYYEYFVKTLRKLGIPIDDFTKEHFLRLFESCATVKFAQCLMMNQVIKSKPEVVPKMEDIKSKENFLTIGGGEIYQRKMIHTVELFQKRGWLKK